MDIAIVTGAASSLGLTISRRLIQLGFRVYGLGGDYSDCPLQNVNFRPVACNLADAKSVQAAAQKILEKEKSVLVLVNNAKYFGKKNYLEMSPDEMQQIMNINLLCPLLLARTFAEGLINLQGFIIQLGPLHVESSRGGPAGAATAGGLKWMSELLFHDLREYGVKVCHLSPEPNRGRDPRTTPRKGTRVTASIDPEAVAQAVEQLLQSPYGNIVTEMVIRPLRVSEPEHDPVVKLPYPSPKPVPYTVPREMIEAEDQIEEEEYQKRQELNRQRRKSSRTKATSKVDREDAPERESKRPTRKGSEGERREKSEKMEPDGSKPARKRARKKRRPDEPVKEQAKEQEKVKEQAQKPLENVSREAPPAAPESRRRSRRKPKPPKVELGFHTKAVTSPPEEKKPEPEKADTGKSIDKVASAKPSPAKKTTRKTAAKKTARKTARKSAKKAASEKPAKEKSDKSTPAKKATRKRVPKKKTAIKKDD